MRLKLVEAIADTMFAFRGSSNAFAPWEAVDFISIRKLSQPPYHHPSPTHFFRKSSESLIQYYIDSLYYITYNMINRINITNNKKDVNHMVFNTGAALLDAIVLAVVSPGTGRNLWI